MIKLKQLLVERTLYHGTTADRAQDIEKYGLIPQRGEFVSNAYGGEYETDSDFESDVPELTFAADKEKLSVAVTAATQHVANKLKKDFHSVTDEEFIRHAAIVKIIDGEHRFQHRPPGDENYYGQHPTSVEPGDYYSEEPVGVDEVITGNAMVKFLRRYGLWPRTYGKNVSGKTINQQRAFLIRVGLKKNPEIPKQDVVKKVMGVSSQEVTRWYEYYKREERLRGHDAYS